MRSTALPCVFGQWRFRVARTRILPGQKLGEEGVVVGQRLAGGSRFGGCLARGREVGELGTSLLVLLLTLLGNGTCGKKEWSACDRVQAR